MIQMSKKMSDYLRIRLPSDLKQEAEIVFNDMGMSISEAVRIFIKQAVNRGALPFIPQGKKPNATTLESFQEAINGDTEQFTLSEFQDYLKSIQGQE